MASTVTVSPTRSGVLGEPTFVLDDVAGLALHDAHGFTLVTAIFPWGTDSVFNRIQIPTLLSEIRAVASKLEDRDVGEQLMHLAEFIDRLVPPDDDRYAIFLSD